MRNFNEIAIMKYKSSHGTLFYYDPDLYIWKHANPTMLFLLGFESVTTYDNAISDTILISKLVHQRFNNNLVSLEHFDIFDDIYSYLSSINQTEDFDSYLVSSLHGLKLLLNDLTGTGKDRTIPLIFHTDINAKSIDLNDPMYRLPESDRLSKSYFDLQAQKICDIFDDAGFNRDRFYYRKARRFLVDKIKDGSHIREYSLIKSSQYDSFISSEIDDFNNIYYEIYKEMDANKNIVYKLDYASMYSYAFGVLYGCICLEYPVKAVFKLEPIHWYNGLYFNLVNTAWHCFRFGYNRKYLGSKDSDDKESAEILSYLDIRDNKLKNYSDLNDDIEIHSDDRVLYNAYLDDNNVVVKPIIYSKSTDTGSSNYPGSYADAIDFESSETKPIDDIVSQEGLIRIDNHGVISSDDLITMYIASDQVKIYRAYAYESPNIISSSGSIDFETGNFLSPRPFLHFVPTGDLGWIEFNEDEWRTVSYSDTSKEYELIHPNTLSLMPMTFNQLPQDRDEDNNFLYFGKALDKKSGDIITYYKCLVACTKQDLDADCNELDHIYLYGIFDGIADLNNSTGIVFPDNDHFKSILSDVRFSDSYIDVTDVPSEFTEQTYYDLSTPIILLTNGVNFICIENDEIIERALSYFGYTTTPSVKLPAYIDSRDEDDHHTITEYDLRYNSLPEYGYWSSSTRQWSGDPDSQVYIMSQNSVTLYAGEIDLGEFSSFTHRQYDNYIYIYSDGSLEFAKPLNSSLGFISIGTYDNHADDSLYNKAGITEYLCPFIIKDDNGNYLTSNRAEDGKPLVWYDNISHLYWNGLHDINRWQTLKPILNSQLVYNSLDDQYGQAIDDPINEIISIDGSEYISYDEFYSDNTRGVIRYKLQVFNSARSEEGIIDCLVDDKNDPDHPENTIYCIPGVTQEWVSRERLLPEFNYRFVDGMTSLYSGADRVDVVIDDDFVD